MKKMLPFTMTKFGTKFFFCIYLTSVNDFLAL